jgi:hypothetical protein
MLARAVPRLTGPAQAKTRWLLQRAEMLTFLDHAETQLAGLALAEETVTALLTLEEVRQ